MKTTETTITIAEFIAAGCADGFDEPVFTIAHNRPQRVSYVRNPSTDPWIVCPDDNGGFGMSYCVCLSGRLYIGRAAADAAAERAVAATATLSKRWGTK